MRGTVNIEDIEIQILLDAVLKRYGYDFRHYSRASLQRRLTHAMEQARMKRFTEMLDELFHNEEFFDNFLRHMSVTVTDIFRDPLFYKSVREKVIPALKTFPFIKVWHAGCATGEEVYSMAIMLREEKFLNRSSIYATDFNKHSLDIAQKAVYSSDKLESYASNYRQAGGCGNFSDYYSSGYNLIKFKDYLKERVTFSYHNLVTDGVFGEMNIIFCRNVLIYFDKDLQNHTLNLLSASLRHGGYLCLGDKESLNFTTVSNQFEAVDDKQRIFKKTASLQ